MGTVNGINEDALRDLCMEILDYNERILEIFDKVDNCVEDLQEYYKCSSYNTFKNAYNDLRRNYQVIKESINSYSDDFITLIQRMHENEKYLVNIFGDLTEDYKLKAKQIRAND